MAARFLCGGRIAHGVGSGASGIVAAAPRGAAAAAAMALIQAESMRASSAPAMAEARQGRNPASAMPGWRRSPRPRPRPAPAAAPAAAEIGDDRAGPQPGRHGRRSPLGAAAAAAAEADFDSLIDLITSTVSPPPGTRWAGRARSPRSPPASASIRRACCSRC